MNLVRKALVSTILMGTIGSANAGIISFSGAGGVVDNSSETTAISVLVSDISGFTDSIIDVNLTVDFSKCGIGADASGCTGGSSSTYNREIEFDLSHLGTNVDIISEDTFTGQNNNARVTQTYDDAATTTVGGSTLLNGTFNPIGSLSDFAGMSALGLWEFIFADTVGADALVVHSWTLDIELAPSASVPEPSSLAIFGLGLAALGFSRKKKAA